MSAGKVVHCKREPCDVYIGRPSKWGNPFIEGEHGTREEVIDLYEQWFVGYIAAPNDEVCPSFTEAKKELHGKVLGCWCAPKACHGDVLIRIITVDDEET